MEQLAVEVTMAEERFAKMSQKYEAEQADLKKKIGPLQAEIRKYNRHNVTTDEFLAIVRKYTDMQELTQEILAEFVDRIVVHHAEKVDGEKFQDVEIFYNCIGKFVAPTLEELPRPQIKVDTMRGSSCQLLPRIVIKEECPYRH